MNKSIVTLLFCLNLWSSLVFAEGGGLNISYNNINIRVEFNDNIDKDNVTGMEYIREPAGLLYDLIYLLQNNKQELNDIKQDVFVEADNLNKSLSIYLKYKPQGYVLDSSDVSHFDKEKLLKGICQSLKVSDCIADINNTGTYLFYNESGMTIDTADLVEFGCFPCENKKNYTLTYKKAETTGLNNSEPCKKLKITRKTIGKYFKKI